MRKGRLGEARSPLALVRCFLRLLQLLQSCCQSLLGTIQLFLNQLDASVQRSYVGFSLGREWKARESRRASEGSAFRKGRGGKAASGRKPGPVRSYLWARGAPWPLCSSPSAPAVCMSPHTPIPAARGAVGEGCLAGFLSTEQHAGPTWLPKERVRTVTSLSGAHGLDRVRLGRTRQEQDGQKPDSEVCTLLAPCWATCSKESYKGTKIFKNSGVLKYTPYRWSEIQ